VRIVRVRVPRRSVRGIHNVDTLDFLVVVFLLPASFCAILLLQIPSRFHFFVDSCSGFVLLIIHARCNRHCTFSTSDFEIALMH
jgi:hypothetical protein